MSKMIPHRAMDRFADDPLLKALSKSANNGENLPPGSVVEIECEEFYIIPLFMQTHALLELLSRNNSFDIGAAENKIWLPVNAFQAYLLGKAVYAEYSVGSYWRHIVKICDDTLATIQGKKIDMVVIAKLAAYVATVQKQLRTGLETAKVHVGIPYTDADWQRDRPLDRPLGPM